MDMMREVLTRSSWLAASTYFLSSNALLNAPIASWNWEHRKYHFINHEQLMHCSFSASNMTTCVVPLLDGRAPLWQHCFSPAAASALHIQSQPCEYSPAPASKCTNIKCDQLLRQRFNQALFHTLTSFSMQFLRPSISLEISSTWTMSSWELWRLGRKSLYLLFIVSHSSSYEKKYPELQIPNWFRGKMFKSQIFPFKKRKYAFVV